MAVLVGGHRIEFVDLSTIGRILVFGALGLLVLGGAFLLLGRLGVSPLPGDRLFRRGNLTIYFPIGLMILISIVGAIFLNLFLRR